MNEHIAYHWSHQTPDNDLIPNKPLLSPEYQGISGIPDWAYRNYLFCFIDSYKPAAWFSYDSFRGAFYLLVRSVFLRDAPSDRINIFSFKILESDAAYVVDRGFILFAQLLPDDGSGGPLSLDPVGAYRRYINSRVPFKDYNGKYHFPELIFTNKIDASRLTLVKTYDKRKMSALSDRYLKKYNIWPNVPSQRFMAEVERTCVVRQ